MILEINQLKELRKNNKDKKIVLALGSFDLFHYEHLRYLKDAKSLGDILVVAVKDDNAVKVKGKSRPFMNEQWRCEIIDGLKCVDYVIIARQGDKIIPQEIKEYNDSVVWWKLFSSIFENLKPDILYYEINEKLQPARDLASKIFDLSLVSRVRTELTSTSKIIEKIKNEK